MKPTPHISTSTRLIAIICALCLSAPLREAFADEQPIIAETLFEDGSTNTWTQTDLTDALGLMNRKYHRDIETEAGRRQWHGKRMGQYLLDDGNGGQRLVQLYEDGFAWTNKAIRVSRLDPEAAAKAKAAAEARQAEWERTHLPPDVAALLKRRRDTANGATNAVTAETGEK